VCCAWCFCDFEVVDDGCDDGAVGGWGPDGP